MRLVKIKSIKKKHYTGKVHDITVKYNHSYNINGIAVHNSVCTTRLETGHGIPSVTAIQSAVEAAGQFENKFVIADGGIRNVGDIAKALSLGADFVMLGSMLAGTDEAEGAIVETPNGLYKRYKGSASLDTKLDHGYHNRNVEGVSTLIPHKGGLKFVLQRIEDGLRSAFSYTGARTLDEFQAKAHWIPVSNASRVEATPHLLS